MPPPFRADHIGSLMRPQELLEAQKGVLAPFQMHNADYSSLDPGRVQNIKEMEKQTIADVVRKQVERGITPITSGEFERPSFVSGFFESLDGVEIQFKKVAEFKTGHPIMRPYVELGVPGRDQPIAVGKVKFKKSAYLADFEYVKGLLPNHLWGEIKMTIPSPSWSHTQLKDGNAYTAEAYTDEKEYLTDIGKAMRQEVLALYDAGCRFVQIDDPMFAMMVDDEYLEVQKSEGRDLDALMDPSIMVHNMVVQDLPSDLTIALHLCRGNIPKGMKAAVGGYHKMASKMFREMHYKRFALEWDNDLVTGNFTPLEQLPQGKLVVLGLVTTKIADMEDIGALKSQVMEAAEIIGKAQGRSQEQALDSLAVSPSCGFSSVGMAVGTGMNEEVQWQKLELLKELAADIWGSPTKL